MAGTPSSFNDINQLMQAVDSAVKEAHSQITLTLANDKSLRPAFLRLAFFDAILHDPARNNPQCSIHLVRHDDTKLPDDFRRHLRTARDNLDKLIKDYPNVGTYVSRADLYQLAGIVAIKAISGMNVKFKHGRPDSRLPIPLSELQKMISIEQGIMEGEDVQAIKDAFSKLGFSPKEVVALYSAIIYWMAPSSFSIDTSQQVNLWSIYNELRKLKPKDIAKVEGAPTTTQEAQTASGTSATTSGISKWKFLVTDAQFREFVDLFAQDHKQYSETYMAAHEKLAELGFQNSPKHSHVDTLEYHDVKHGIAFAVAMTIFFGVVGFFYEAMRRA